MTAASRLWAERQTEGLGSGGWVVAAGHQTAGRGRFTDRRWVDEPGAGLQATVLLSPAQPPFPLWPLPLACALGLALVYEDLGLKPEIKWPNDVLVEGRKTAGLLTVAEGREAGPMAFSVGLGVNVQRQPGPADLRRPAVSLAELGLSVSPGELLGRVLARWAEVFAWPAEPGLAAVERRLWGRHEPVEYRLGWGESEERLTGRVLGLSPEGHLRIESAAGLRVLVSGE